jgi:hypothetical protein
MRRPEKVNGGEGYRQAWPENLREFTIFTMIQEKAASRIVRDYSGLHFFKEI